MNNIPTSAEIHSLFANSNPDEVWDKASDIVRCINPEFDFRYAKTTFDDVVRLARGEYPGYCSLKALYHNLTHTLDVFLCAVRLMHGVHLSGTHMADHDITMIMMSTMFHDVGYAQQVGDETGTGAQYTQCHVERSIEFMERYIASHHFPSGFATFLKPIILCTNPALAIPAIEFPDEHTHLLGQIVGSADLAGQMADRTYLEKLMFLYLEFNEANFGGYQSIHDMLRKTVNFYEFTRKRLDGGLGGIHTRLSFHFKDWFGVENNYYLESIERNIDYLSKVISLDEEKYLPMLKRGGIVEEAEHLITPKNSA
ncbi:MAG: hypothetical protein PHT15_02545 [Gallionellaceae bacterium]|nr:hypothetical protein [Gallionellaceae bacterium]